MAKRDKISIFVLIDAFGWEIVQRHPFLDDILSHKQPLQTVFGYSSSCDPTILTGKMPQEHGHFSFFVYDPERSPFKGYRWLGRLPKAVTSRGRVRNQISKWVGRHLGITGYFQLYNVPFDRLPYFDYTEKRDIYQPGGINGGQETIFDHLRQRGTPFFLSDWHPSEQEALAGIQTAVEAAEVDFAFVFLGGLDGTMHRYGTRGPQVEAKIAEYDRHLRRAYETALEKYDEVRLFVFSDHGMADVVGTCDLIGAVEATGLVFGRDYAAMYDSTMARFWFMNDAARQRIGGVLDGIGEGRVLSDEWLADQGCAFDRRRYGDLFFLLDPGRIICPSYMGERPVAGMHGYAPGHADSVAGFLSNVVLDAPLERLDGLCRLMEHEAAA